MERWKPENGDLYWIVDACYRKGVRQVKWVNDSIDNITYKFGNCFKTEAKAEAAAEKVKSLLLSLHTANDETLKNKPLPKLTAEVFDRPDCPENAKIAVVNDDGFAYWGSFNTARQNFRGGWEGENGSWFPIPGKWDSSEWQNSLIKRPTKDAFDKLLKNYAEQQANKILQKARERRLPEQYHNGPEENKLPKWVEVGGYVFDPARGYGKIISGSVNTCHIQFECMEASFLPEDFAGFKQARLRPYNADEIPNLPFEVSEINSDFRTIVVSCKGDKIWLAGALTAISTEELMRNFDCEGFPCGVLEHLENGEWVE